MRAVAALLGFAFAACAGHAATVVSNTSETTLGIGLPVGVQQTGSGLFAFTFERRFATSFTTGNAAFYTLNSITAAFNGQVGSPQGFRASLFTATTTVDALLDTRRIDPGAELVALSGTAPATLGNHTFACAGAGCRLSGNTTYFVVFAAPDGADGSNHYQWRSTSSDNQTQTPAGNGWLIGNDQRNSTSDREIWAIVNDLIWGSGMFSVDADVLELRASGIAVDAATLTIAGHGGAWYHSYAQPPGGTCSSSVATPSTTVSGLQSGTTYVYGAYRDVSCSAASLLATTTFATLPGKVSGVALQPGNATLRVSWNAVTGAERYRVQWKSGGQQFDTARELVVAASELATTTAMLTNGVAYTVRVAAANVTGTGAWSDPATATPEAIRLSASTLPVPEGGTSTYSVALRDAPSAAVIVAAARRAGGDADLALVGPAALTFAANAWSIAQTFTVSAAPDFDAVDGTAVFEHMASSSDAGFGAVLEIPDVTAIEQDAHTAGITLLRASSTIAEGGSAEYALVLDTQPTGAVEVETFRRSDGDAHLVISGGASLIFAVTDWSIAQAITLSALEDDDARDGTAIFEHTASSVDGTYAGIAIDDFTATEADNDTAGVSLSARSVTVREGGTQTYSLMLDTQPAADVTLSVANRGGSGDDAHLTAAPALLTFTDGNWSAARTVTISAAQDDDEDNGTAVFVHAATSTDADYSGLAIADLTATEDDDDDPGVTLAPGSLTVPEGASSTYSLVLETQPEAMVVIGAALRAAPGDDPGFGIAPSALTFTTQNWNIPQTVRVSSAPDVDARDGAAAVLHAASTTDSGYAQLAIAPLALRQADADTAGVAVSTSTLAVPEGAALSYAISLDSEPAAPVTIAAARRAGGDADLALAGGAALVFTAQNWSVAQSFTVSAAQDFDAVAGTAVFEHAASSTDAQYAGSLAIAAVAAVEVEDDRPGVSLSAASARIAEGGAGNYSLRLDSQPAAAVQIDARRRSGDADLAIASGASLTFAVADWSVPQTVRLTAAPDFDARDGTAVFAHAASSTDPAYGPALAIGDFAATEIDDDAAGVAVSTSTLAVPEGGMRTYSLALRTQPAAAVAIDIARRSGGDDSLTALPARITFAPGNWSAARTVTVAAAADADGVDGTAAFDHAATSTDADYRGIAIASVAVAEIDDDVPGVTLSRTRVTVAEGGTSTYAVVLDTQPSAQVVVAVVVRPNIGGGPAPTASPAWLTFEAGDWSERQTVTVSAAQDLDARDDESVLLNVVSSADSDYQSLAIAEVAVQEIDDDAPGVAVSPTALAVPEGGSVAYALSLATQPAAAVTIVGTRRAGGDEDLSLGGSPLVFTTQNWSAAQSLTVSAAEDFDARSGAAVFEHAATSTDAQYGGALAIGAVSATEVDDDAAGVALSATSTQVAEGGTAFYTVALDAQPTAAVQIDARRRSGDADLAIAAGASLTFSRVAWNVPQTVLLTAAQDFDGRMGTALFAHTASSTDADYGGIAIADFAATERDDDSPGVAVSTTTVAVAEGSTHTYTLVLQTQPTAAVTIAAANRGGIADDADLTVRPAQLVFSVGNWSTAQTATVSAAPDADRIDGTAAIVHAASSTDADYGGIAVAAVAAVEDDDDAPGITVSRTAATVAEGGISTYAVVLDAQPTAPVVVAVAMRADPGDDADLTASPDALTFLPGNWAEEQTVTLSAAQDVDARNGASAALHAASSTDAGYDGIAIARVAVSEADDDAPGATVSVGSLSIPEGAARTYSLTLDSQPAAAVTIIGTRRADGDADLSLAGSPLVFTAQNWSVAQFLTVSAAQDVDARAGTALFEHAATSTDAQYGGALAIGAVSAAEVDDDMAGVSLSATSTQVDEGGTAFYAVALDTQPTAAVRIDVRRRSGDADLAIASGASLTFARADWNMPQMVLLTAAEDFDGVSGTAAFAHTASSTDADYGGIAIADVAAAERDNDPIGVAVSPAAVTVPEGAMRTYTLVLRTQPTAPVAIAAANRGAIADDADLTVQPAQLVFSVGNWSVAQTATVSAAPDLDDVDGTAAIAHFASSTDAAYHGIAVASVLAAEDDDDDPGIRVSRASLTVPEGGTSTYAVVLDTQPSAPVAVGVSMRADPGDDADLAARPSALTFGTGDWNAARTVTVSAAPDFDARDGAGAVLHAASSTDAGYDGIAIARVAVSEVDSDTPGVSVSATGLSISEGAAAAYSLTLDTRPAAPVTVSGRRRAGGDADLSLAGSPLVFTARNWSVAQFLTVSAAQDVDARSGTAVFEHAASSTDAQYAGLAIGAVLAVEVEDDAPGVSLSSTGTQVAEGGTAFYTVVLDARPAAAVQIDTRWRSGDAHLAIASGASLTFTRADWSVAQTVLLTAAQDLDGRSGRALFAHAASSTDADYAGIAIPDFVATERDDDPPGVAVSTTSVVVAEGATRTYTLALRTRPAADVTIAVANRGGGSDDPSLTARPPMMTFTASDWSVGQTATISAAEDADGIDGTAAIAHAASSTDADYDGIAIADVTAVEDDDDSPGVTLSRASVTVDEGGEATYAVALDTQPSAPVAVGVSMRAAPGDDADLTARPAALTFAPGDWDAARTVTVSAAQDFDARDGAGAVLHSASSTDAGYHGIAIAPVQAVERDDDAAGVTVSTSTGAVVEGGTATYALQLDTEPSGAVTIAAAKRSGGDAHLALAGPSALVFTMQNWSVAQSLTVSAAQDDDALSGSAVFEHAATSSDAAYGSSLAIAAVAFAELDDDAPGVSLSATSTQVDEGGTAFYTVALDTQPAAAVAIAVSKRAGGDGDLVLAGGAQLLFSMSNWSDAQTVTLSAAQDFDARDGTAVFAHAASSTDAGYRDIAIADVAAAERDDDAAGVSVSDSRLTVVEGGTATYTLALRSQPSAAVTIGAANRGGANDDADLTVAPALLTFATGNWSDAQTATVSAAADADRIDGTAVIEHMASSTDADYGGIAIADLTAVEDDSDVPGVSLSRTEVAVAEGGEATYAVVLDTQPLAPVAVAVSMRADPGDDADLTAAPAALTFAVGAWNAAQTVTVSAAQDFDARDGAGAVLHSASSTDADYGGIAIAPVAVSEADDDAPGVSVSPGSLAVPEGAALAYSLVLDSQPAAAVTIAALRRAGGDADLSLAGAPLVFTTQNWNAAQFLTVSAAPDFDARSGAAVFEHAATSTDAQYGGDLAIASVSATEVDDDAAGVSLSATSTQVDEGGTAFYAVALDTQPTAAVQIDARRRSGDADLAIAAGASLTFTRAAWNMPQTVLLTASEDFDGVSGTASFAHTASSTDADYGGIAIADVAATERDDDPIGVMVSATSVSVAEGASRTYTLVLQTQPSAPVAIALANRGGLDDDGSLTVAPAVLIFTTGNWSTAQTATLSAAQDADEEDGTAVIVHVASSGDADYAGIAIADVTAAEDDDDDPGVRVSRTSLTVAEGGTSTYAVVLDTQPSAPVAVAVSMRAAPGDDPGISARPAALTFAPGDWNAAQTVTVSAAPDVDARDGAAAVLHAASSTDAGYDGIAIASVRVSEVDADTPGVTVSANSLSVAEGSAEAYALVLDTEPAAAVAITGMRRAGGDADLSLAGAPLVFTAQNWSVAQFLTVSAADDFDALAGTAVFEHAASSTDAQYGGIAIGAVSATEVDDDAPSVSLSATSTQVAEGGTAFYTVALDTEPSAAVLIDVRRRSGDADLAIASGASLTFTRTDWSAAQTVLLTAAEDFDGRAGTALFAHAASSTDAAYAGIAIADFAATEAENDAAGVAISTAGVTVPEGSERTYTLVLRTQPSAPVAIALANRGGVGDDADLAVSPPALTFSTVDWSVERTATVSAAPDGDGIDGTAAITHAASSTDADYHGIAIAAVTATEDDASTPGVTVSRASLAVPEGGTSTYAVVLDTRPSAPVVIGVAMRAGPGDDADLTAHPAALTFAPGDWNAAQTVTVSAAPDFDARDGASQVLHAASSTDAGYDGIAIASVAVSEADADTAGVSVSTDSLAVPEGSAASYALVLDTRPAAAVTITGTRRAGGDADLSLEGTPLVFTAQNWSVAQFLTVSAAQDFDALPGTAVFAHAATSTDAQYGGALAIGAVLATEVDDDAPGVSLSATSTQVAEGGTAFYTVALDTQPAAAVLIDVRRRSGDADLAIASGASLTFARTDWSAAQTVLLAAAEDFDGRSGTALFAHAASSTDAAYAGIAIADFAAAESENDAVGVAVSTTSIAVAEGSAATYALHLQTQPSADVTIAVANRGGPNDDASLTVRPAALTFTTGNWSTAQTATVSAAQDADDADGAALIAHVARSGDADYDGIAIAGVMATAMDDDNPGISLSRTSLAVPEGGTSTYAVVLDTRPSAQVVVGVSMRADSGDDADLTALPAALTFATGDWNAAQTVTVSAAADFDARDGASQVLHAASSADAGYHGIAIASVAVSEVDADTPGVSISTDSLSVGEGTAATYSLVLDTQPAAPVTITGTRRAGGDADLSLEGTPLVFTAQNWSTAQFLTVSAAQDYDALPGTAVFEHAATSTDVQYGGALAIGTVSAAEADDDAPGVALSATSTQVAEGGTAFYTLALATQPSSAVLIDVRRRSGDADLAIASGASLTFTRTDWSAAQTVLLTAAEDFDGRAGTALFAHAASSTDATYAGIAIADFAATEAENDAVGVAVSAASIAVAEGASATYTLHLQTQPSADVAIALANRGGIGDDASLTVQPARMTFATGNWSTAQTATVSAAEDGDRIDGTALIVHAASSTDADYDGIAVAGVTATATDNDDPGITLSRASLAVPEGGTSAYTVVLDAQPSAQVVVGVSMRADPGDDADLSALPAALTFATGDWSAAQTVTVSAAPDFDARDGASQVLHAASSTDAGYDGIAIASVAVSEVDDDTPGVSVSTDSLAVSEGSAATYSLVLDTEPAAAVTIAGTRRAGGDGDLTLDGSPLVFTAQNWSTAQFLTVSAAQDFDALPGTAVFEHAATSTDAQYGAGLAIGAVSATEVDDDAPGVTLSATSTRVAEGGTAFYTLVLNAQPSSAVLIDVRRRSGDADLAIASGASLTFARADWSAAQTVLLTAAEDFDGRAGTALFAHSASSTDAAYAGIAIADFAATEAENDAVGVAVSTTSIAVAEGGAATYALHLRTQPSADVTIAVANRGGPNDDASLTASPAELTFTIGNWSAAQTATVSAAQDADDADGTALIAHSARSADADYDGIAVAGVTATADDDDDPGVRVSRTSLTVLEGGTSTYTVVLDTRPPAQVVIAVSMRADSGDDADLTAQPAALTFATGDWNAAQTVTVSAAADFDARDGASQVRHAASSADAGYHGIAIASVAVSEVDDDTAGVSVSTDSLSVSEGSAATYSLVLDTQPAAAVTIIGTRRAGGDADLTLEGAPLVFTVQDWSTAQFLTVSATQDFDALPGTAVFAHAATSTDAQYGGALAIGAVSATEVDDDAAGVTLSATSTRVAEGGTAFYAVALDTQPAASVHIDIRRRSGDADLAIASGASLTFARADWSDAQTVLLTAAEDFDGRAGTALFAHTASSTDADYGGIAIADFAATEAENDAVGVAVSAASIAVAEGASATYTLHLRTQPSADVTIGIANRGAPNDDASLAASPAELTFTTGNWSAAQTATVSAAQDADDADGTALIAHSARSADADYDGIAVAGVTATADDDDDPGVRVSRTSLTVPEGGTSTYTVVLDTRPPAQVVIAVSMRANPGDDASFSASPAALTFAIGDWNAAQTVTVSAAADFDARDGASQVLHAASSMDAGYHGIAIASVAVSEADDDTAGVSVSTDSLPISEGSAATYSLVLDTEPAAPVTIAGSRRAGGDGDLTLDGSPLAFTAQDWSTAQFLTVSAAQDFDALPGTAVFEHAASSPDAQYGGIAIGTVSATEVDDDAAGVSLSATSTQVAEGGTAFYAVALDTEPSAAVQIDIRRRSGDADLAIASGASLTFARTDWSAAQTVLLTAAEDFDGRSGTALFAHTASSTDAAYAGIAIADFAAAERDDDAVGVAVSVGSLAVPEGSTRAYTLVLQTQPSANVTIGIANRGGPNDDASLTAIPAEMTFTTGNWSAAQTATVSAAQDADDANGTALIAHAARSGDADYHGIAVAGVTATADDDDDPGVSLSRASVMVDEGGTSTYALVLDTQPTAAVTIGVSMRAGPGDDADISALPAALTFATGDWNAAQTVTVSAVPDLDARDGAAAVLHAASSADAGYHGLAIASVQALERDGDTAGVTVSTSTATVPEGGSATYALRLDTRPAGAVTIAASKRSGGDAHLALAGAIALTFTADNWSAAQSLTVSAAQDDDALAGAAVFAHAAASADADYGSALAIADVAFAEVDDDMPGIVLSAASIAVAEAGGTATYRVRLATQPTAGVAVELESADATVAAVAGMLTFTMADWSTGQTATVTGVDDDRDNAGDQRATMIVHRAAGGDYAGIAASIAVTATDDDASGFAFSPQHVSVADGASSTYAVALQSRPRAAVTVDIRIADADSASSIVLGSTTRLIFAEAGWNRPRTVALRDDRSGGRLPSPVRVEHRARSADTGYHDLTGVLRASGPPTFGAAAVADQNYAQGRRIAALVLPEARFGIGTLAYALTPALPAGLVVDLATRTVSGTPRTAQEATEYTWRATDAAGAAASLTFRIAVVADAGGGGGSIEVLRFADSAVPAQSYFKDRAIAPLTLPAAVGGRDPIRYALLDVPPGLTFDSAKRVLSGTPSEPRAARRYVYRATDATGAIATLRFAIVIADNERPRFGDASVPMQTFAIGRSVSITLPAATGGDGQLAYALSPALPPGLAFDPASRRIEGTPAALLQPTNFLFSATDENGDAATLAFAIEVVETPPDDAAPDSRPFLRGWRLALPIILESGNSEAGEETPAER